MPRGNVALVAFNRGVISKLGLSRTDNERVSLSAETQTNFIPRSLGPASIRPGFEYTGATKSNNKAYHIPFIFSISDDQTAILELTNQFLRIKLDEAVITRPSVSSAVTNGNFTSDVTGWTDADDSGTTSAFATGGFLSLTGTGFSFAKRRQQITVSVGDRGTLHAFRIIVEGGEVRLRGGISAGGADIIPEVTLTEGEHSIAFIPTDDFYVELASSTRYATLVDSINIEGAADVEFTSPWVEDDLKFIRHEQSADVVFVFCKGYAPYRIERRGETSWSLVKYYANDGPFRTRNVSTISMTPSALNGDITLTSNQPYFTSGNVGSLFQITSVGQTIQQSFTDENQESDEIRITGVGAGQRTFSIVRSGTWTATVTLQRSVGEPGAWVDITTYTGNGTTNYNDGLDNQIIFYRLVVKTGDYTSGTAVTTLSYSGGGLTGICRVTEFTSETSVSAIVLSPMGATSSSADWAEGEWSARRGFPSSVSIYESRLTAAGKQKFQASLSDGFSTFDSSVEGDSRPISATIGSGPLDNINWIMPLQRLILGGEAAEWSVRSTTFEEPLTQDNKNIKRMSTEGSNFVDCAVDDGRGYFVDKTGKKIFEVYYSIDVNDYVAEDITKLSPEITGDGIVKLAVQRSPDVRIHAVRTDGKVAMLVRDSIEKVRAWVLVETDGEVEDAFVIPSSTNDRVYYSVKRTINSSTVRYIEKWANQDDCKGGLINKIADSFILYDSTPTTSITGLSHLEGENVIVWADGKDVGTKTVASGAITLDESASKVVVGLGYDWLYVSSKLAYASALGTALNQVKRVDSIGLILIDTHYQGVRYGSDINNLFTLPPVENGRATEDDKIWEYYDEQALNFDGVYDTDSRIVLSGSAPKPATVSSIVIGIKTNDRG